MSRLRVLRWWGPDSLRIAATIKARYGYWPEFFLDFPDIRAHGIPYEADVLAHKLAKERPWLDGTTYTPGTAKACRK